LIRYKERLDVLNIIHDKVNDIIPIIGDAKVIKVNPLVGFVEVDKVIDILL
jgi:hypothetical protein